ncbi:MAG TPA: alpha/beta hydrolase [Puia sp.]
MKNAFQILAIFFLITSCSSKEQKLIPVKNGDVNIAYHISGKGDTAIVFVHGWSINKEYWLEEEPTLAKRFTVVALDLAGHGQSGHNRTQWTIENYAKDVIAVIHQLSLKKVIVVGHSMAGEICLLVATALPDKVIGLIGIDNLKGFVQRYTPKEEVQSKEFLQELRTNYDSLSAVFVRQGLFPQNNPDTVSMNRVIRDARHMDPDISVGSLESLMYASLQDSALIGQLNFPVHLIACDPAPDDSALRAICKSGYSVRMIHGTGHYPMIEKPVEFTHLLEATIDDIAKRKN